MVDVMGHVAMGLLFAIPAWFVWNGKVSLAFIGLTVVTAPIPDVDLWLAKLAPAEIHHHGVTHTVIFTVAFGLIAGAIVAGTLTGWLDRWFDTEHFDRKSMFVFASSAFILGGLSHLFADMLSAPDIATPIEPFWPFFDKPWSIDIVWYNAWWINSGLLALAVLLHLGIWYVVEPFEPYEHRFRLSKTG
jgi:hypothetical protein